MYKELVLEKVLPYKIFGYKILEDGTELFGLDKSIAPQAWLHQIFPPLSKREINQMEEILETILPDSLINFYNEMNGFRVFVTQFSFEGLRKNFSRSIESSWQPFSIETPNKQERISNAKNEDIFIGFYSKDGRNVYMNSKNETVSTCARYDANPIKTWDNLYQFLVEELTELFSIYGSKYFQ